MNNKKGKVQDYPKAIQLTNQKNSALMDRIENRKISCLMRSTNRKRSPSKEY